jgi:hypothetical protein
MPASIDKDTQRKSSRTIPANANGTGSIATPLNGLRTTFNFSNGTNQKMRFDTTCLEVDLLIANVVGTGAASAHGCPDWNMFGRLIEQIKLMVGIMSR